MDKYAIRKECERLMILESISDSQDLIDIYLNYLFKVINNHHDDEVSSYADKDAEMVNQMMFTKIAHIKRVIEGINYESDDGNSLKTIIDPTIVASLIRNVYETVCMFNLIYRNTNNEDEKTIIYDLWVHAGLMYRQRFEHVITTEENREKYENEKEQMSQLEEEIKQTKLFKDLSEKDQEKIEKKLKEKDYKIRFKNNEVEFLSWQDITEVMGLRTDTLESIYTYFSLYSHPSNVAVFQFADMFSKGDEPFKRITNSNLTNLFIFLSIYIADYIHLFPKISKTFNKLNIIDQVVINYHNIRMRGLDYSINDALKELD